MNYKDYFDKIYVISYIKNYDKREKIKKELKRIGIIDYEFAYSYDTTIINNPNNIDYKKLSVSFTHYDIIKKSYELNYNHILIIEDDVMFLLNENEIHNLIEYNENLNYDINYYDYQYRLTDSDDTIQIFLTSCYSLNRQGMLFYINNFEYTPFLIDGYMSVYTNDYHTIPNTTLCYLDGNGNVDVVETYNTSINLSSKRICIQDGKFEIYNDEHGNICNLNEYNLGIKKSTDCIIIIPLYKDYLYDYEEISLKQCINVLSEKYFINFIIPNNLSIDNLFNKYNINIKYNIDYDVIYFDHKFFESINVFNKLLTNTILYDLIVNHVNYKYMLLYELDGFVFYDNLQYWIDKDYDYVGSLSFEDNSIYDSDKINYYHIIGGVSLRKIEYERQIIKYFQENSKYLDENIWEDMLLSLYSNNCKLVLANETFDFCWTHNYDKSYVLNNFKLPMFLHQYQKDNKFYNICKEIYYKNDHE